MNKKNSKKKGKSFPKSEQKRWREALGVTDAEMKRQEKEHEAYLKQTQKSRQRWRTKVRKAIGNKKLKDF